MLLSSARDYQPAEREAGEASEEEGELEDDGEDESGAVAAMAAVACVTGGAADCVNNYHSPEVKAIEPFRSSLAAARSPLMRLYVAANPAAASAAAVASALAPGTAADSRQDGYHPPPPPPPASLLGSGPSPLGNKVALSFGCNLAMDGVPLPPLPFRFDSMQENDEEEVAMEGVEEGETHEEGVDDEEGLALEEGEKGADSRCPEDADQREAEEEGEAVESPSSNCTMTPLGDLSMALGVSCSMSAAMGLHLMEDDIMPTSVSLPAAPGLPGLRLPAGALSPTLYAAGYSPRSLLGRTSRGCSPEVYAAANLNARVSQDLPATNNPPLLATPTPGEQPQWLDDFAGTPTPASAASYPSTNAGVSSPMMSGSASLPAVRGTAPPSFFPSRGTQRSLLGKPPGLPLSTGPPFSRGSKSPLLGAGPAQPPMVASPAQSSGHQQSNARKLSKPNAPPEPNIPSMAPDPPTRVSTPIIPKGHPPVSNKNASKVPKVAGRTSTKRKRTTDTGAKGVVSSTNRPVTVAEGAAKTARIATGTAENVNTPNQEKSTQQHVAATAASSEPPSRKSSAQASSVSPPAAKKRRSTRLTLNVALRGGTITAVTASGVAGKGSSAGSPGKGVSPVGAGVNREPPASKRLARATRPASPAVESESVVLSSAGSVVPAGPLLLGGDSAPRAGPSIQPNIASSATQVVNRKGISANSAGPSASLASAPATTTTLKDRSESSLAAPKHPARDGTSEGPTSISCPSSRPPSRPGSPTSSGSKKRGALTLTIQVEGQLSSVKQPTVVPGVTASESQATPPVFPAIETPASAAVQTSCWRGPTPGVAASDVPLSPVLPREPEFAGPYVLAWRSVVSEITSPVLAGEHMTADTGAPLKFAGVPVPSLVFAEPCIAAIIHPSPHQDKDLPANPGVDHINVPTETAQLSGTGGPFGPGALPRPCDMVTEMSSGDQTAEEDHQQRVLRLEECVRRQTELLIGPAADGMPVAEASQLAGTRARPDSPDGQAIQSKSILHSGSGTPRAEEAGEPFAEGPTETATPVPSSPPSPTTAASSPESPRRREALKGGQKLEGDEAPQSGSRRDRSPVGLGPVMVDVDDWRAVGSLEDIQIVPETVAQVAEMLRWQEAAVGLALECLGPSIGKKERRAKRYRKANKLQIDEEDEGSALVLEWEGPPRRLPEIVVCGSSSEDDDGPEYKWLLMPGVRAATPISEIPTRSTGPRRWRWRKRGRNPSPPRVKVREVDAAFDGVSFYCTEAKVKWGVNPLQQRSSETRHWRSTGQSFSIDEWSPDDFEECGIDDFEISPPPYKVRRLSTVAPDMPLCGRQDAEEVLV